MNHDSFTQQYHDLVSKILESGVERPDPNRSGITRLSIPFADIVVDLRKSFPAITTKKLAWKSVVVELLWFLSGSSDVEYLRKHGVKIWDADAQRYGKSDLGRIYGKQWRNWSDSCRYYETWKDQRNTKSVDQISELISALKTCPLSSSLVVSSWNAAELDKMALPPCHYSFQVCCEPTSRGSKDYYLDLIFNMRSSDVFLGLPFNMASYALLSHILSKFGTTDESSFVPRYVKYSAANVHLYSNQIEAAEELLERPVDRYCEPRLRVNWDGQESNGFEWWMSVVSPYMFVLENYVSFDSIKVDMLSYD